MCLAPEGALLQSAWLESHGPTNAIRRFVSEDGSDGKTLEQLRRRYPNNFSQLIDRISSRCKVKKLHHLVRRLALLSLQQEESR